MSSSLALIFCIFIAAMLYSSVGHGGGSGYLAVMALFGAPPESMRPAALSLNVLVATIGLIRFYRVGAFSWSHFWPFAVASVPCAFLGSRITLPIGMFKAAVGVVLLFAAYRLFVETASDTSKNVPLGIALACGAGLGLLSGLTGVGGGVFLSPLLLFMGWTTTRQSCGVAAAFILVNSIAGILGLISKGATFPAELPFWVLAAATGGLIGAELGSRRLNSSTLRKVLAIVLIVSGMKMLLDGMRPFWW
jgi:uncharacterized membrane protein YfcA